MSVAVAISTRPSPGLLSAGQMQRLVLSYVQAVQDDPELNDIAMSALNSGISLLNTRNWLKQLAYQDITLVSGTASYELNMDFRDPFHCERLNADDNPDGRLHYKELKTLLREHPVSTASGSPNYYSVAYGEERSAYLDVAPDLGFVNSWPNLRFRYYRRFPYLAGPGDVLGSTPEFDWFLVWYARHEIATMRNPSIARMASENWSMRWRQLKIDDADTLTDWSDA